MDESSHVCAVIMAGGSGTRFWPLSTSEKPKQYLPLTSRRSLIQETWDRLHGIVPQTSIFVVSTEPQHPLITQQLPELNHWILEPSGKNTGPCLMLTLKKLLEDKWKPNDVMIVLPADHFIGNPDRFRDALITAVGAARKSGALVTLGIQPDRPHTGYGYIERGTEFSSGCYQVHRFVEKPSHNVAAQYLATGNFFWNAGIFVWTLEALENAFETHTLETWNTIKNAKPSELADVYTKLESIPIDIAILEPSTNVLVVPTEMQWSDIGSWDAVYRLLEKNSDGIAQMGARTHSINSSNSLVYTTQIRNVALVGVENLIVVQSGENLLILNRNEDQRVKELFALLQKQDG